jgi:hypothetical protein
VSSVGWVERSETHHGLYHSALPMMGFAALNPSYANHYYANHYANYAS